MTVTAAGNPVVLVVEDHDDTREMLQVVLHVFGCQVLAAQNGEEAMTLAEETRPDLILLDIKMPRLDGLTLTRMIRSHPTLNRVPIVAVTGMVSPQFHRQVLDAGCNHCLDKPIDFERLEKLVSNADCTIS
jgi:CheY-like chemotaxis protein